MGYPDAAWRRAMTGQEVVLKALSGVITVPGRGHRGDERRTLRHWLERYEQHGYVGLVDKRRQAPSVRRIACAGTARAATDEDARRLRRRNARSAGQHYSGAASFPVPVLCAPGNQCSVARASRQQLAVELAKSIHVEGSFPDLHLPERVRPHVGDVARLEHQGRPGVPQPIRGDLSAAATTFNASCSVRCFSGCPNAVTSSNAPCTR